MMTWQESFIKNPHVFEFLNIPENYQYTETDIEKAIINNLQQFLLELGKGFAFIGRQQRITLNNRHYFVDLVFYHVRLKCYVLIDLKIGWILRSMLVLRHIWGNIIRFEIRSPSAGAVQSLPVHTSAVFLS